VLLLTLAFESRCPSKHVLTYEIKKAKSSIFKRFLKIIAGTAIWGDFEGLMR
jgi:hypothetical protein